MNTETRNFSSVINNSTKVAVSFKLVALIALFILALIGSWSLDGLFFKELFISGIIVCTLMWCREVSLKMEEVNNDYNSIGQN